MNVSLPPKIHTKKGFFLRFLRTFLAGLIVTILSLFIGIAGYRYYENMSWVDAYANAAMILAGMGPLSPLVTDNGKIFAATYALFSGIIFLVIVGIMFAPVFHIFFKRIHLESDPSRF